MIWCPGGQDEETTEQVKARAPLYVRGRGQAVTEEDFRRVAEDVPGVDRAIVLSCTNPAFPGAVVPGSRGSDQRYLLEMFEKFEQEIGFMYPVLAKPVWRRRHLVHNPSFGKLK